MDSTISIEEQALEKRKILNEAILSGDSQVQKFYDDAVVFVTGGSGFIGKQLIEKLMRSANIRKMYMLVRPKKGKSVVERVNHVLKNPVFTILRNDKPSFVDKIVGIEGDVSEINLGIDEKTWAMLTNEVNVIIHAAATVNLVETIKMSTLINIRGTREMLKLAKSCTNIKSIVHVSTTYANATKSRVKDEVKEDFYDSPILPDALIQLAESVPEDTLNSMIAPLNQDWPNSYTFTKTVTEDLIRRHARDLPICIVRPAIVIAAYEEPMPGWVDEKNAFGPSGMILGPYMGVTHTYIANNEINVELVPVDLVNNAIIAAAWETYENFKKGDKKISIYAISGKRNPIKWGQLRDGTYRAQFKFPAKEAIWYRFAVQARCKFIYVILSWLLHYIPALIIDGCCLLMGKKPRLLKTYKLADTLFSVFNYYTTNDWVFCDANTFSLYNKLSDTDKLLYNCDMASVDIVKMVFLWCYGVMKYIAKEEIGNIEYATKKQFCYCFG
ncbi:fatty acyl-CoA reductase wat-like [Vanessa atalanta]|uniref:fatty acyl-CoA reductase wat-like n=1 Tax=Vanessa atalanta TaxID=42275 RepID=UPI001FCD8794|nr:fatty acyl-CoA reductase wat-like [Vanessa atalanta]